MVAGTVSDAGVRVALSARQSASTNLYAILRAGFGADHVRSTSSLSPRDDSGHGTQMTSIAAGNSGVSVEVPGLRLRSYSGVAPQARISVYKACWTAPDPADDGCSTADVVAGFAATNVMLTALSNLDIEILESRRAGATLPLVVHPGVQAVSFTGSVPTGRAPRPRSRSAGKRSPP